MREELCDDAPQAFLSQIGGARRAAEAQGDSAAGDSVCGLRSRSLFEQQVEHQPPGCFGQSQVTPDGRLAGCV